MQEWNDFDATASQMGVGGLTAQLRKNATPSNSIGSQLSRAISTTGRGLESGRLDKALKGASGILTTVAQPVNAIVPGAGTVIEDAIIGLTAPGLLGSVLVSAPVASVPVLGTVAGDVAGSYFLGTPTPTVVGSLVGTEAQAVTIGTGAGSLSDKLMSAGLEAISELSFAISVVTFAGGGGIALEAINLALTALKASYTVANALRAADALKKAAAAARAKALADEAAIDKQIRDLQAEIARVRAETDALSQRGATPNGTPSAPAKALGIALLGLVAYEVLA